MTFEEWWDSTSHMLNRDNWSKQEIARLAWSRGRGDYVEELKDLMKELDRKVINGTI